MVIRRSNRKPFSLSPFPYFLISLLLIAGGVWGCAPRHGAPKPTVTQAVVRPPYDPKQIQETVAFHAERVKNDPQGAIGLTMLAGAYLQRCRETGDLGDAARAERAARRSLAIRTRNNAAAYDQLAASLLTQHRFGEALRAANRAATLEPDNPQAACLRAEILIERGDYEAAKRALRAVGAENSVGKTLRARLNEIQGRPQVALEILRQAQAEADRNLDLSPESVAWFHLRVGLCMAGMGRAVEAEKAFREAIALFPRDYRAMTALARLDAAKGDWQGALTWGQKAAEIVPTPEVVALLGDAFAAQGNPRAAQAQYRLIEAMGTLARAQGVVYDRQRALFCADHDLHLDEALRLAQRELQDRQDIYAYDTLAWVLLKNGRPKEAEAAMERALSQGTQDALLFYHAGRIAEAQGHRARAEDFLIRALSINPYFHPLAPADARKRLAHFALPNRRRPLQSPTRSPFHSPRPPLPNQFGQRG